MSEFRFVSGLSADAGEISGMVFDPGITAPPANTPHGLGERFEPGAFGPASEVRVLLNVQHDFRHGIDSSFHPEGSLRFRDTTAGGMEFRAQITPEIRALVAAGKLTGTSLEFDALSEQTEGGVRVIERGRLLGLGLVDSPVFPNRVELRRRTIGGTRVSGRVPLGRQLPCRCKTGCARIRIGRKALDKALREAAEGRRTITAFMSGRFSEPVAATGAGLRLRVLDDELRIEIDQITDNDAGRAFLDSSETGFWSVRPWAPEETSVAEVAGDLYDVSEMDVRAIELALVTGETGELAPLEITRPARRRRRIWL